MKSASSSAAGGIAQAPITHPLIAVKDIWGTNADRIDAVVARYSTLYGLPVIKNCFVLPPEHLEREQDLLFTVVAIRRADRDVYLVSHPGDLHPRLPGRALLEGDAPEDVAAELVRLHLRLEPAGMTPVAVVSNQFRSPGVSARRTHVGVAFDVRVAGKAGTQCPMGYFTRKPPARMFLNNRKILDLAFRRPCRAIPIEEATEDHTESWRGWLHGKVVRPLVFGLSSRLIRNELLKMMPPAGTLIDVACGDDTLVLELGRKLGCKLIVGNDICWRAVDRLRDYSHHKGLDLFLSNHDITELPFNIQFDAGLVKNVLHHIPGVSEASAFLARLRTLTRTVVLVEYEDPQTSRLGRFWNRYYEGWLGDGAVHLHHFLTETKLLRVVQASFPDARIELRRIWTIKGYCLLTVIEFPS